MSRFSLQNHEWPNEDRILWDNLISPVGLLDEGGACAQWATETKRMAQRDYGYWLQYLLVTEPDALALSPTSRVTQERALGYCQSMSDVCALTRAGRIARLFAIVRGADREKDWRWLATMKAALDRAARREQGVQQKHRRIRSSGQLFAAGLAKLSTADQMGGLRPVVQAEQFRDGLIIALLAARPLRIKNFSALRLGQHLLEITGGYSIFCEPACNFDPCRG